MTLISFKSVLLKAEFWFCLEVIALWLLHASTANQTGFKKFQGLTISKYSLSKSILVSVDRKYFLIRFRSFNLFFFLLVYFKVFCSSKWPVCFFFPPNSCCKKRISHWRKFWKVLPFFFQKLPGGHHLAVHSDWHRLHHLNQNYLLSSFSSSESTLLTVLDAVSQVFEWHTWVTTKWSRVTAENFIFSFPPRSDR